MNRLNDLSVLLKSVFNKKQPRKREMKRVFQWERYLEWKDLTSDEKLSAKRFLLVPVLAYLILWIFNQNFTLIVLLLIGYLLYRRFEKGGIIKK
tara:strand:- start:374 stop:655 length:282 start_codon:yes stop_codon:yes gene_type:complete